MCTSRELANHSQQAGPNKVWAAPIHCCDVQTCGIGRAPKVTDNLGPETTASTALPRAVPKPDDEEPQRCTEPSLPKGLDSEWSVVEDLCHYFKFLTLGYWKAQ